MSTNQSLPSISAAELETCIKFLSKFCHEEDQTIVDKSDEFKMIRPIVHKIYRLGKKMAHRQKKDCFGPKQTVCLKAKQQSHIPRRRFQQSSSGDTPVSTSIKSIHSTKLDTSDGLNIQSLQPKRCYLCKLEYSRVHYFYDRLCLSCSAFNYGKRLQTTNLSNCIALVINGRVNVGYRTVLKLLHANCFVITTSRFPIDFLNRLRNECDFEQWKDRVHIYAVDFRYPKLVESFTDMLIDKYERLDFLINNASQTIQQDSESYQHLLLSENLDSYSSLSNDEQKILEGNLQFYESLTTSFNRSDYAPSSLPASPLSLSYDNQQNNIIPVTSSITTLQSTNSSLSRLNDVATIEMNEILTVHTLAPFILCSKLKALMIRKHPAYDNLKFIINVSTVDSLFSQSNKSDLHPHTNAAKAAMNMMTRTSAVDYARSNIYMISVDTGILDDDAHTETADKSTANENLQTPFDDEDGAARVLDPIFYTFQNLIEGKTNIDIPFGRFLKHYHVCDW